MLICGKASSSKNIFLEEVRPVIIYQLNIKYGYVSQACMLILHRVESNKTRRWSFVGSKQGEALDSVLLGCLRFQESACSWPSRESAMLDSHTGVYLPHREKKKWQTKQNRPNIQKLKGLRQPPHTVVLFIS